MLSANRDPHLDRYRSQLWIQQIIKLAFGHCNSIVLTAGGTCFATQAFRHFAGNHGLTVHQGQNPRRASVCAFAAALTFFLIDGHCVHELKPPHRLFFYMPTSKMPANSFRPDTYQYYSLHFHLFLPGNPTILPLQAGNLQLKHHLNSGCHLRERSQQRSLTHQFDVRSAYIREFCYACLDQFFDRPVNVGFFFVHGAGHVLGPGLVYFAEILNDLFLERVAQLFTPDMNGPPQDIWCPFASQYVIISLCHNFVIRC